MTTALNHRLLEIFPLGNEKVAVMEDMANSWGGPTITNTIEDISEELRTEWILYQDSNSTWDSWHKDLGFMVLGFTGNEHQATECFLNALKANKIQTFVSEVPVP